MNYIDALKKTAKRLDAEFEASQLIQHSPSKGAFREYIVKHCIRPFCQKHTASRVESVLMSTEI